MTKGTPQPTDKCGRPECGKTYSAHSPPFASCPGIANLLNDRSFTPIVPSPDSVRDMGEVTKHTPAPWTNGWGTGLTGPTTPAAGPVFCGGDDWSFTVISKGKQTIAVLPINEAHDGEELKARAELIAAAPATAARLEEVTEALRGVCHLIDSGWLVRNVQDDGKPDFALRQLEPVMKLKKAFAALSRGVTEQSTEQ